MDLRLLVCGGRDFVDREAAFRYLDGWVEGGAKVDVVIHGAARGADTLAGEWAAARGIPVLEFPADWKTHGKKAGPIRNQQMLDEGKPNFVVAFPGGAGTADMVGRAKAAGLPTMQPSYRRPGVVQHP